MNEIVEFERRISLALDRIGKGAESLHHIATAAKNNFAMPEGEHPAIAEVERLTEALEAERGANAQLTARVRALHEKQGATPEEDARVDTLARQLDAQGVELQRLKQSNVQMRETMQAMRDAMAKGIHDPALVNKSMAAELEALRATRAAEIAELDGILLELKPLIGEGSDA
ncbi:MAG: hypothetical protein KGH84_07785 [Paracoccaceae bacterium]|nr:hypothetical protein [Paracoccaceae bacterium]